MFGGQHIEDFNFEYSASTSCSSLSMKLKIEIFEYNFTKYLYEFCLNLIGTKRKKNMSLRWTTYLKVKRRRIEVEQNTTIHLKYWHKINKITYQSQNQCKCHTI